MKSLLTIPLMIIYLLGNTESGQLINLPKLLEHYKQDHYRDHKIGFIKFLAMHYCTDDGTSADDTEDDQLPFKQPHGVGFFFAETPNRTCLITVDNTMVLPELNTSFPKFFIKNIYLHIPLQPPRLVMI